MKTQNVIIKNEHGLHLRVASQISRIVRNSGCPVNIQCEDCPKINACSIVQLLMLGATKGTSLEIEVEEQDEGKADAVLQELVNVFGNGEGI